MARKHDVEGPASQISGEQNAEAARAETEGLELATAATHEVAQRPADRMVHLLETVPPFQLVNHMGDIVAGMHDVLSRLEALESK